MLKERRRPDSQETAWDTEKHRDPGVVSGGEKMMCSLGEWSGGNSVCNPGLCSMAGGWLRSESKSAAAQPEN